MDGIDYLLNSLLPERRKLQKIIIKKWWWTKKLQSEYFN